MWKNWDGTKLFVLFFSGKIQSHLSFIIKTGWGAENFKQKPNETYYSVSRRKFSADAIYARQLVFEIFKYTHFLIRIRLKEFPSRLIG